MLGNQLGGTCSAATDWRIVRAPASRVNASNRANLESVLQRTVTVAQWS
jgi:hypothetical protein